MKGAATAPEERGLALGPHPALGYGATSNASLHPSPVSFGASEEQMVRKGMKLGQR